MLNHSDYTLILVAILIVIGAALFAYYEDVRDNLDD